MNKGQSNSILREMEQNLEAKINGCHQTILSLEHTAAEISKSLQEVERKIHHARVECRAFEEALRLVKKEERKRPADASGYTTLLRPGTTVAWVRDVIYESGRPLHIKEIMERIGKPGDHRAQISLVGSLAKYVKSGRVFTRTDGNTFGLLDTNIDNNTTGQERHDDQRTT